MKWIYKFSNSSSISIWAWKHLILISQNCIFRSGAFRHEKLVHFQCFKWNGSLLKFQYMCPNISSAIDLHLVSDLYLLRLKLKIKTLENLYNKNNQCQNSLSELIVRQSYDKLSIKILKTIKAVISFKLIMTWICTSSITITCTARKKSQKKYLNWIIILNWNGGAKFLQTRIGLTTS